MAKDSTRATKTAERGKKGGGRRSTLPKTDTKQSKGKENKNKRKRLSESENESSREEEGQEEKTTKDLFSDDDDDKVDYRDSSEEHDSEEDGMKHPLLGSSRSKNTERKNDRTKNRALELATQRHGPPKKMVTLGEWKKQCQRPTSQCLRCQWLFLTLIVLLPQQIVMPHSSLRDLSLAETNAPPVASCWH